MSLKSWEKKVGNLDVPKEKGVNYYVNAENEIISRDTRTPEYKADAALRQKLRGERRKISLTAAIQRFERRAARQAEAEKKKAEVLERRRQRKIARAEKLQAQVERLREEAAQ